MSTWKNARLFSIRRDGPDRTLTENRTQNRHKPRLDGKFVPIHITSGRHRALYLAEYCRVGKITHRRWVLGTMHWVLKKVRSLESSPQYPAPRPSPPGAQDPGGLHVTRQVA